MYNGDSDGNNINTSNVSTTQENINVEMKVKAILHFIAIKNKLSLFQTNPKCVNLGVSI